MDTDEGVFVSSYLLPACTLMIKLLCLPYVYFYLWARFMTILYLHCFIFVPSLVFICFLTFQLCLSSCIKYTPNFHV
jgi:hypothetical protein